VLGQLPGGHILLATRRDVDWRRLAVRSRAWSSALPAAAPAMTTDSSSSTIHLVRLTRSRHSTQDVFNLLLQILEDGRSPTPRAGWSTSRTQ
jgi:hypothetical protein